jgi:multiple sugar transport system permease protein
MPERRREARAAYFFLLPALIVLSLFTFGPWVFIFVVAFSRCETGSE